MKNFKRKFIWTVLLSFLISFAIHGQTNVSGGIYSNTTWTLANSPYVVTDTVVVFPGVTLTIEPGVVVKFDTQVMLELNQATLISQGTATDSITFTSNAISPAPGDWEAVFLLNTPDTTFFNYCNFYYGYHTLRSNKTIIKNSLFKHNSQGLYTNGQIDSCKFIHNSINGAVFTRGKIANCVFSNNGIAAIYPNTSQQNVLIENCIIDSNGIGINCDLYGGSPILNVRNCSFSHNNIAGIKTATCIEDTIINCTFVDDSIALDIRCGMVYKCDIENNYIGIKQSSHVSTILCNKICNNTAYDFYYTDNVNYDLSNNYWCTFDSVSTAAVIYDGYDNIIYGLVQFMPIDTLQCYLTTTIPIVDSQRFSLNIFPNPASDYITVELTNEFSNAEIKVFNMLGELEFSSTMTGQKTNIDVSSLTRGMYIIQIATGDVTSRQKIIKQ